MTDQQVRALRAKILGAILREARVRAGKGLRETGTLIGVSSATLSSYEHGRKAISLPELEVLAYFFDIPLSNFWTSSPEEMRRQMEFDPLTLISLRQRIIGAQIRAHRHDKELSLKELAGRVELPVSRLSSYERGESPVPIPDLEAIAAALGRETDEFFDEEGPVADWNAAREAYEEIRQLPMPLIRFLSTSDSERYLELAKQLGELDREKLRSLAQALLDISS